MVGSTFVYDIIGTSPTLNLNVQRSTTVTEMNHKNRGPLTRKTALINCRPSSNSDTFSESTSHPDAVNIVCTTAMGCNAVPHPSSRVDVAVAHGQVLVEHESNSSIDADRLKMHASHDAGGSFLVDWDSLGARRSWRTGAWQSMSVGLLSKRKENQESRDDFESFLWTLLYNVLRYRPTCVQGLRLQSLVYSIFDEVDACKEGGDGKLAFFDNRKFGQDDVEDSALPAPLQNILEALRDLFLPLYPRGRRLTPAQVETRTKAEEATSTSEAIKKIFEENLALAGWPSTDNAEDQLS
ncbi:hypothetical protein OF83DRAFT_1172013 [Amylostereum chailletii]|nr:hypothetical protein OF83DRAFT_1172013 [Amylostereum chailletii]